MPALLAPKAAGTKGDSRIISIRFLTGIARLLALLRLKTLWVLNSASTMRGNTIWKVVSRCPASVTESARISAAYMAAGYTIKRRRACIRSLMQCRARSERACRANAGPTEPAGAAPVCDTVKAVAVAGRRLGPQPLELAALVFHQRGALSRQ